MRAHKREFVWESFFTLMSWSNENKNCMRVDKREFLSEFSQFSCPGLTRTISISKSMIVKDH